MSFQFVGVSHIRGKGNFQTIILWHCVAHNGRRGAEWMSQCTVGNLEQPGGHSSRELKWAVLWKYWAFLSELRGSHDIWKHIQHQFMQKEPSWLPEKVSTKNVGNVCLLFYSAVSQSRSPQSAISLPGPFLGPLSQQSYNIRLFSASDFSFHLTFTLIGSSILIKEIFWRDEIQCI